MNIEDFKKINLKQKIFFSIFISFVFLFLLSFFVILPSIQSMIDITIETKSVKNILDMKMSRAVDHHTAVKNYQTVKSNIHLLDQIFIQKSDSLLFVDQLENIAEKNNVSQSANLINKNEEKKDFYSIIPLQVSVSGEEDDILNYLKDLEDLDYYINIKDVDITNNVIKGISNKQIAESISLGRSMVILADTFWIK